MAALDREDVDDEGETGVETGIIRNIERTRILTVRSAAGAFTTAASCETADGAGGMTGACCAGPRPNSVAMSHVGNGAVKGAKIKSTSQLATIRESMTWSLMRSASFTPVARAQIDNFSEDFATNQRLMMRRKCLAAMACDINVRHLCDQAASD
jgi:hypothetical protein